MPGSERAGRRGVAKTRFPREDTPEAGRVVSSHRATGEDLVPISQAKFQALQLELRRGDIKELETKALTLTEMAAALLPGTPKSRTTIEGAITNPERQPGKAPSEQQEDVAVKPKSRLSSILSAIAYPFKAIWRGIKAIGNWLFGSSESEASSAAPSPTRSRGSSSSFPEPPPSPAEPASLPKPTATRGKSLGRLVDSSSELSSHAGEFLVRAKEVRAQAEQSQTDLWGFFRRK